MTYGSLQGVGDGVGSNPRRDSSLRGRLHDRRRGAGALLLGEGGPGCRPRRNRLGGGKRETHRPHTEKEQTLDVAKKAQRPPRSRRLHGVHDAHHRSEPHQHRPLTGQYVQGDNGGYVLVSIHMNGSTNATTDYTTTLFGKWRKDKELANTVFGPRSRPAHGQTVTGNGSGFSTRTPYSFASGVLLKSNMPATIAETVFITND